MITWKLAWRSFVRHRRRSIITTAVVALSLAMMIFFVGVADDSHARMAELGIRMGQGHVLVQGAGYQAEETLDHLVADPKTVMARARQVPAVEHAVPRVRTSGLISAGGKSAPAIVSGVDPKKEPLVSEIAAPKRLVQGKYLRRPEDMPFKNTPLDIYLGVELAKTLEVNLGDRVVLTLSPRQSSRPAQAAFRVRGIFRTGVMDLDRMWVEIPITEAQRLLKLGGQVTQVALLLHDLSETTGTKLLMQGQLPHDLEILAWQEALKQLYDAIVLDDAGMYMMMTIIFIIVVIGIFNTVLMSVVERTREFGVMMSLGCKGRKLFEVVMAEAFILALVSAATGLAVGLLLHHLMATHGIDITAYAKDYQIAGVVFEGRIYSRLTVAVVAKWTLVVMGLTVVSAIWPALAAARLKPLEAMRHV